MCGATVVMMVLMCVPNPDCLFAHISRFSHVFVQRFSSDIVVLVRVVNCMIIIIIMIFV